MERFSIHIWSVVIAIQIGGAGSALAVERDVKTTAVPTRITGTLSPLSLLVDGHPILSAPGRGFAVTLNGGEIRSAGGRNGAFSVPATTDMLEILVTKPGNRSQRRASIELPRLGRARLTGSALECQVEGPAQTISLDGRRQELIVGTASIPLPKEESFWDRPHSLRIEGVGGRPGRSYSVTFSNRPTALPELGSAKRHRSAAVAARRLDLASFQLGTVGAYQDSAASSLAPEVSWNPTWILSRLMALRGNFGVMAFKASEDQSSFAVTEYEVLLSWLFQPLVVEIGGGLQTWWHRASGTHPVMATNTGVYLAEPWLGMIDRLFVGYEAAFGSPVLTHEVKLGLGLRF